MNIFSEAAEPGFAPGLTGSELDVNHASSLRCGQSVVNNARRKTQPSYSTNVFPANRIKEESRRADMNR
jgi:hypothetical protein